MNGGGFEGVDGYMNLHGFMSSIQLPGTGDVPTLQGLHLDQQQHNPANIAAPGSSISSSGTVQTNGAATMPPSRYESQKRRDWNTFGQYLRNHRPPLALAKCSGAHVLEFLRYLDQFGKTKVHTEGCPFYGHPQPPSACACPLRQAWGSLDALIGRLRAAFEENGGKPESNPFGARAVRLYLRDVREKQAKARGIAYEKKKRKRPPPAGTAPAISSPRGTAASAAANQHAYHQHQANMPSALANGSPRLAQSSLLLSHTADSVKSSPSSVSQILGVNQIHAPDNTAEAHLHSSTLGFAGLQAPDHHTYHNQYHLPQAAAVNSSPPALIRSFN